MTFCIEWTIDEPFWVEAREVSMRHGPGSDYDLNLIALEELLPGTVRFTRDGWPMVPVPIPEPSWERFSVWPERNRPGAPTPEETHFAQGFTLVVPDLAWQLAFHLDQGHFAAASDGADVYYLQADDSLRLRFLSQREKIHILSNELRDHGWMLVVPAGGFFAGVRGFLASVAKALQQRVPALLGWTTFAPLVPYLPYTDPGDRPAHLHRVRHKRFNAGR